MLAEFPRAAEWDWQSEQLEVVRALASNTRAVVQLGQLTDVSADGSHGVNDRNVHYRSRRGVYQLNPRQRLLER